MKKIILSAYVIICLALAATAQKHYVGEKWGGGVVFNITPDSLHGLIAETKDQGSVEWRDTHDLIAKPDNHSVAGKAFDDWYLPSRSELQLLYNQKDIVGGFHGESYWSSSELDWHYVWAQNFFGGYSGEGGKYSTFRVRAVRAF